MRQTVNARPIRRLVLGAVTASIAVLTASCASGNASSSSSSGGTIVKGGTITYAHEQEPPCIFGGWIQQDYLDRNIFDSLVAEGPGGKIEPWLATSWTVSPDGKTYTFTLKPGVKFTDGTPLNAQAVAYNFDYWIKGGNSTAEVSIAPYYQAGAAKALDATHLQIHLTKRYLPFLTLISQSYSGIQSPTALKHHTTQQNCDDPIGSGAFSVKKWNHGQDVILVRNPNYTSWPATAMHKGPALVNEVDWKFVSDGTTRYASLTSGQTNVIYDVPTVDWKAAKSQFQVEQYITPGHPVSFFINTEKGPFTDVRLRQAFAYGADRKAAVESGFHGVIPYEGNPSVSQSTPGYNAAAAADYAYNPAKANQLLDAAGWTQRDAAGYRTKNGKELDIRLVYGAGDVFNAEGATVLQDLQQQWKQIGMNVKLEPLTQAQDFSGKFSGPDGYDAYPWYWTSPSSAILWIVYRPSTKAHPNGSNQSFYNSSALSALIQKGNTAPTTAVADKYYGQAQQLIQNQAVSVGLYTQTTSLAIAKNLHDVWLEKSQGAPVFEDAYFTK
jgi:peptide/nickel transport system substrate-binding protein